jgi:hypothetical protein
MTKLRIPGTLMLTTDTMCDSACAHRPPLPTSPMRKKGLSDMAREGNLDYVAVAEWRPSRAQQVTNITYAHHCGSDKLGKTRLHVVPGMHCRLIMRGQPTCGLLVNATISQLFDLEF